MDLRTDIAKDRLLRAARDYTRHSHGGDAGRCLLAARELDAAARAYGYAMGEPHGEQR